MKKNTPKKPAVIIVPATMDMTKMPKGKPNPKPGKGKGKGC